MFENTHTGLVGSVASSCCIIWTVFMCCRVTQEEGGVGLKGGEEIERLRRQKEWGMSGGRQMKPDSTVSFFASNLPSAAEPRGAAMSPFSRHPSSQLAADYLDLLILPLELPLRETCQPQYHGLFCSLRWDGYRTSFVPPWTRIMVVFPPQWCNWVGIDFLPASHYMLIC